MPTHLLFKNPQLLKHFSRYSYEYQPSSNMVSFARLATTYLLATSSSSSRPRRSNSSSSRNRNNSGGGRGGRNVAGVGNRNKHRNKGNRNNSPRDANKGQDQKELLPPPPPVTIPGGPFPSYYTCRHTYEDALMEEISRASDSLSTSSPSPGLVRVETTLSEDNEMENLLSSIDPIYALQSMPNCVVVTAPSIKQLALKSLEALHIDGSSEESQLLRAAPRGSLSVHALVPGMFKGQRDPVLKRRADKVAEEASSALKKGYKCARKRSSDQDDNGDNHDDDDFDNNRWVLQLMLLSPEVAVASLAKCSVPLEGSTWPNWKYPAGMANVDIEEVMPSSAYRKLLEAFECLRILPPKAESLYSDVPPVVDLGACPGGWTAALRMLDCKVIAVDRSELVDNLMTDEMVEFVKGDAFSYQPPWAEEWKGDAAPENTWMVSDVIAYPERVAELLNSWCGNRWAENMIVTVKFQGQDIPWDALDTAVGVATNHGYKCRVKHFFNNKNEVTLMVSEERNFGEKKRDDCLSFIGKPMYPLALP